MKMIVFKFNKKKIGVTVIVILLMFIMFVVQTQFSEKIKLTSLIQSNIESLKEYKAIDSYLVYKLPEDWCTLEEKTSSDEIIYHNNFESQDLKIHGFVEVWNLKENLKEFLDRSKDVSMRQNTINDYKIVSTEICSSPAFIVSYTTVNSNNDAFKSYEYFIDKGNKFTRFSFFVADHNFKENMPTIFKTIVKTSCYNKK